MAGRRTHDRSPPARMWQLREAQKIRIKDTLPPSCVLSSLRRRHGSAVLLVPVGSLTRGSGVHMGDSRERSFAPRRMLVGVAVLAVVLAGGTLLGR